MTPNPEQRVPLKSFKNFGHRATTIPEEELDAEDSEEWKSLSATLAGEATSVGVPTNADLESNETTSSVNGSIQLFQNGLQSEAAELVRRQRRAEANALFDPDALRYLYRLNRRVTVSVDDVNGWIAEPIGWTKIAQLMQAYFIEVVGFHFRITEQGKDAIANMQTFIRQTSVSRGSTD